jgi:hypothetical protein
MPQNGMLCNSHSPMVSSRNARRCHVRRSLHVGCERILQVPQQQPCTPYWLLASACGVCQSEAHAAAMHKQMCDGALGARQRLRSSSAVQNQSKISSYSQCRCPPATCTHVCMCDPNHTHNSRVTQQLNENNTPDTRQVSHCQATQ